MELTINISNLLGRFDLAKCTEIYKNAGFTAADYSLEDMIHDGSPFCGDDYRANAEGVRKTIEAGGLKVWQTHAPFSFRHWSDEANYRDVIYPRLVRSVEISAMLGAKVVVMHPLHHMQYHGHEEEIFRLNMDFYRGMIPYCKEYGIKMGIENMWQVDPLRKTIIHDTCSRKEEFVRYIDTLDSEYMVACLDLGHVGLPQGQDDQAQDVIRALGHDRLQALHVHDNDYRADQHVLPYLGKLNWTEITRALGEINYQGDFTYEVNCGILYAADEGFVPTGTAYMADIGKHLIAEIEKNRKV